MADIATALKAALAKSKPHSNKAPNKGAPIPAVAGIADLGLSTYEMFDRAIQDLIKAKNEPRRIMDAKKIVHIERCVETYRKLLRDEVRRFGSTFPGLTHAELSKKALEHKVAQREELLRQEAELLKQAQHEKIILEKQAKADKRREAREEKLREQALLRAAEEEKLLTEKAKQLKKELGLKICKYCLNGKERIECETCEGTGRVAPYEQEIVKTMTDCCNRPTCPVCAGTGIYTIKGTRLTTLCTNLGCKNGLVFAPCSVCYGSRITNKQGKRLSLPILKNIPLVRKIQALLVLPRDWNGLGNR